MNLHKLLQCRLGLIDIFVNFVLHAADCKLNTDEFVFHRTYHLTQTQNI